MSPAPTGLPIGALPEARGLAAPRRLALRAYDIRHAGQPVVDAERRTTVAQVAKARILCASSLYAPPADDVQHTVVGVAYAEQRTAMSWVTVARATGTPVLLATRRDEVDHSLHFVLGAETNPLPLEPIGGGRRAHVVRTMPGGDLGHAGVLVPCAVSAPPYIPKVSHTVTTRVLAPVADFSLSDLRDCRPYCVLGGAA